MQKLRYKCVQVFRNGLLVGEYSSLRETERVLNIKRGNVFNYLKGKTTKIKSHPDLTFKYK